MENTVIEAPKPTYSEILAGARKEEQARIEAHQAQARAAQEEASRARVQQIRDIQAEMTSLLATYEEQRDKLRSSLHRLYELEQTLLVVSTGQVKFLPPQLPMAHLPTAYPEPTAPLYSVVPSFQQEVMTWAQTRAWPKKG